MQPDPKRLTTDVLVIGSGAGGAITAATLAEGGRDVLIIEEGAAVDTSSLTTNSPEAMRTLYRNGGLSPILGPRSIAFVEGCCVGGSTEINSAFWHRFPPDAVDRWRTRYGVRDLSKEELESISVELAQTLRASVSPPGSLPANSRVFKRGLERVGAPAEETPRLQCGDLTANQFAPGAKRSMSRSYLPRARDAGATILAECRATRIHSRKGRATMVSAIQKASGEPQPLMIEADMVFVCAGAIQSAALLRASGIKRNVGNSLCIQPMLKIAAQFDETLDSHLSVMPVYQMRDPATGIFLGGAVFTPGFLALALSDRWPENQAALRDWRQMGIYYTACRGAGTGWVRPFPWTGEAVVRYDLSREDEHNLRLGLARLCEVLFAGGARRLYPGVLGCPPLESAKQVETLIADPKLPSRMSLSTVHVTSSCPMGENTRACAVDSFGRLHGFENLYVADGSIVPDAPGVNPQGTIMALALRNARRFLSRAG